MLARSRALKITEAGNTSVITADLRDPDVILDHPDTLAQIDFDQPVAILLVAVLHFIDDETDRTGSSPASATPWPRVATLSSTTPPPTPDPMPRSLI
nr:SAM-dependent methyltransferase [Micromonospora inyonensis]